MIHLQCDYQGACVFMCVGWCFKQEKKRQTKNTEIMKPSKQK